MFIGLVCFVNYFFPYLYFIAHSSELQKLSKVKYWTNKKKFVQLTSSLQSLPGSRGSCKIKTQNTIQYRQHTHTHTQRKTDVWKNRKIYRIEMLIWPQMDLMTLAVEGFTTMEVLSKKKVFFQTTSKTSVSFVVGLLDKAALCHCVASFCWGPPRQSSIVWQECRYGW